MRCNALLSTLCFVSLAAGSGCQRTQDADVESSTAALDSSEVTSNEAALLSSAAGIRVSAASGAGAATEVAATWPAAFLPAGCAKSTSVGNKVTLVATNCTGPYGMVHVTGTIELVITPKLGGGYSATATATGLQVNQATMSISASLVYSTNGDTQTLSVETSGNGTGRRGNTITRTGSYTTSWGNGCMALDGDWRTTVGAVTYTTTVSGLKRCQGECPAAGGEIEWDGPNRSLKISYDGSADAHVSTGAGKTATVDLLCGA